MKFFRIVFIIILHSIQAPSLFFRVETNFHFIHTVTVAINISIHGSSHNTVYTFSGLYTNSPLCMQIYLNRSCKQYVRHAR